MLVQPGWDLKLGGKRWRYRVWSLNGRHVTLKRLHPTTLKPYGRQTTRRLKQVEAICTGRAVDGGPLWTMVDAWIELPREPGKLHAVIKYTEEGKRLLAEANAAHDMET
jgi:hypothetical protein